jgi:hypothetical protein
MGNPIHILAIFLGVVLVALFGAAAVLSMYDGRVLRTAVCAAAVYAASQVADWGARYVG